MTGDEIQFWALIAIVTGITITRVFHHIFYYRWEAKRQIEIAKAKQEDKRDE